MAGKIPERQGYAGGDQKHRNAGRFRHWRSATGRGCSAAGCRCPATRWYSDDTAAATGYARVRRPQARHSSDRAERGGRTGAGEPGNRRRLWQRRTPWKGACWYRRQTRRLSGNHVLYAAAGHMRRRRPV